MYDLGAQSGSAELLTQKSSISTLLSIPPPPPPPPVYLYSTSTYCIDMSSLALDQQEYSNNGLFTCLSCSIAFHTADDQREHYRSDHHRYNMKRRVAGLPPVSAEIFNQKVLERRTETAIMASAKGSFCEVCGKTYTTENAYRSHINSKKHKENDVKAATKAAQQALSSHDIEELCAPAEEIVPSHEEVPSTEAVTNQMAGVSLTVDADADENQINQTIDEKIAAARLRLQPTQCLFCPELSPSLEHNLTHMSAAHSFFIPDADYLTDITGLVTYLGEKIAVGNVCIYCNGKGREFRTLDAVRKHMLDKAHCKIAYDSEDDRLELSEFYDFTSSYPNAPTRKRSKKPQAKTEEEWEDLDEDEDEDEDEDVDEVIEEEESEEDEDEDTSSDGLSDNQITYGDSPYELVLPSGARIGHRSMRRYYAQSFRPVNTKTEDPGSGAALVRKLIADKNSALVPVKGGFGAFGSGTEVVKARNRGEAREAGRHVREFRDQKRREDFKTRVGFIHNAQKHYRDPLLQ
ncbi:C2H2 type zinc-finger-domain-containing protein [Cytidiella melzeri]|nr:C2H2 type zinc-finger-domain-containing protein [Cytidiella melzeri]